MQLTVSLPDLPPGGRLYADAIERLGFLNQSGIESSALTFTEIVHGCPWADETDRNVIKQMSAAYLSGLKMTDPFAISPMDKQDNA
ncbi:MAG: hypothetical protein AAF732_21665 [Pseudomonadota bacterium]